LRDGKRFLWFACGISCTHVMHDNTWWILYKLSTFSANELFISQLNGLRREISKKFSFLAGAGIETIPFGLSVTAMIWVKNEMTKNCVSRVIKGNKCIFWVKHPLLKYA